MISALCRTSALSSRGVAGRLLILALCGCHGDNPTTPVPPTTQKAAQITLSPATISVEAGRSVEVTATARDSRGAPLSGRTFAWASSSESVATVAAAGADRATVTGILGGNVTVTVSADGVSATAATSVTNPVPAATTLSPMQVFVGTGPVSLTVQGTGFVRSSAIYWNSTYHPTVVVSSNELRTTLSNADLLAAGTLEIRVYTPPPGGGTSTPFALVIRPALPTPLSAPIAAGPGHSCGITTGGGLQCWGANSFGQLGDGSTVYRPLPVAVASAIKFTAAAAGANHTCAIAITGALYCWGDNSYGQGGYAAASSLLPVAVAQSFTFKAATAGDRHTCGITANDTAVCFGENASGQLGNGLQQNGAIAPTPVSGSLKFRALAAARQHTCGIVTDGGAYCWGENASGQLGTGDKTRRLTPTRVNSSLTFTSITTSLNDSCALTPDGAAYCWGNQLLGLLGLTSTVPVPLPGGYTFSRISLARVSLCGVTLAGSTVCWGLLGAGDISTSAVTMPGLSGSNFVTNADGHGCAITFAGAAMCWGDRGYGALGDGTTALRGPTPVASSPQVTAISVGEKSACGLTTSGAAYCWGYGRRLGVGGTAADSPVPVAVAGGLTFRTLSVGTLQTCGLTIGSAAYCWGNPWAVPVSVAAPAGVTWQSISSTSGTSCALSDTGAAYCWGNGYYGQLGTGNTSSVTQPTAVATALRFISISTGGYHTCGLAISGGSAFCWGASGTIGNNSSSSSLTPAPVSGGLSFQALAAGSSHTCGLTTSGQIYCWGFNARGQLGDGTTTNRLTPVQISGGGTFLMLAAGGDVTCALRSTGSVYCWGSNHAAQLGSGHADDAAHPTPIAILNATGILSLGTGPDNVCVVIQNAPLCWGLNSMGEVGDGTLGYTRTAVPVSSGPFATSRPSGTPSK